MSIKVSDETSQQAQRASYFHLSLPLRLCGCCSMRTLRMPCQCRPACTFFSQWLAYSFSNLSRTALLTTRLSSESPCIDAQMHALDISYKQMLGMCCGSVCCQGCCQANGRDSTCRTVYCGGGGGISGCVEQGLWFLSAGVFWIAKETKRLVILSDRTRQCT